MAKVEGLITHFATAIRSGYTVYLFKLRKAPPRKTHSMQMERGTDAIEGIFEADVTTVPELAFAGVDYVVELEADETPSSPSKTRQVVNCTIKYNHNDMAPRDR